MHLKSILFSFLFLPLLVFSQVDRFPGIPVPDPGGSDQNQRPGGEQTQIFAGNLPIVWEENPGVSFDPVTSILSKVSTDVAWDAQTKSVALIPANVQGVVKYTIESTSGTKYLGMAPAIPDNFEKRNMELLVLQKNNKIRIFHAGNFISQLKVNVGDKIRLKRTVNGEGIWKLKVLLNGALLYKVNTLGENQLHAYAGIKTPGTIFTNVVGDAFLKLKSEQTVLANATTGNQGTLKLTAIGGVPPYRFSWSNGSRSDELTGEPGHYSASVVDIDGNSATKIMTLWSTIDWTDEVNFVQNGTDISSTAANASGVSTNTLIPGNLDVLQFEAEPPVGLKAIGLQDKKGTDFTSFSGYLLVGSRFIAVINGQFISVSNYEEGDIFQIRVKPDAEIELRMNPKGPWKICQTGLRSNKFSGTAKNHYSNSNGWCRIQGCQSIIWCRPANHANYHK